MSIVDNPRRCPPYSEADGAEFVRRIREGSNRRLLSRLPIPVADVPNELRHAMRRLEESGTVERRSVGGEEYLDVRSGGAEFLPPADEIEPDTPTVVCV